MTEIIAYEELMRRDREEAEIARQETIDRDREDAMDAQAEADIQAHLGFRLWVDDSPYPNPPGWGEARQAEEPLSSPPPPKPLSLMDIVQKLIDLWTWVVSTGARDWSYWPGWGEGSYWPLCDYTGRLQEKYRLLDDFLCHHCPYTILYGNACEGRGEPYQMWQESRNNDKSSQHAREYLQKLLGLRKELVLNPTRFKVKKQ